MRKFLTGSLLVASIGGPFVAGTLLAGPAGATSTCGSGGTPLPSTPLGDITVNPGTGGTSGTIQVCSANSPVIDGTVTASGAAGAGGVGGYAVADGTPGGGAANTGPGTGYIGVEGGSSGYVAVVGCSNGDYTPNSAASGASATSDNLGNNVIASTQGPGSNPTSGPCAVTN